MNIYFILMIFYLKKKSGGDFTTFVSATDSGVVTILRSYLSLEWQILFSTYLKFYNGE